MHDSVWSSFLLFELIAVVIVMPKGLRLINHAQPIIIARFSTIPLHLATLAIKSQSLLDWNHRTGYSSESFLKKLKPVNLFCLFRYTRYLCTYFCKLLCKNHHRVCVVSQLFLEIKKWQYLWTKYLWRRMSKSDGNLLRQPHPFSTNCFAKAYQRVSLFRENLCHTCSP